MNNNTRSIVGYIRSYTNSEATFNIQTNMIHTYCKRNGLICEKIYRDIAPLHIRKITNIEQILSLNLATKQLRDDFPEWLQMILRIANNEISCILVDTKLRLFCNEKQKESLEQLCKEHQVVITEVNSSNHPSEAMFSTAVYHFTNHPYKRPVVALKDIDNLYQYASQLTKSWEVGLYLELETIGKKSLRYIKDNQKINTVVVKRLFHINRKVLPVIDLARKHSHMNLVSLEEGIFKVCSSPNNPLLNKKLRVLIYNRYLSTHEKDFSSLQIDIYKAFIRLKTNWHIVNIYTDDTFGKKQGNYFPLTQITEGYDVILVDSFQKFDTNIHGLKKLLQHVNKPIYSIKEGEIYFERD